MYILENKTDRMTKYRNTNTKPEIDQCIVFFF